MTVEEYAPASARMQAIRGVDPEASVSNNSYVSDEGADLLVVRFDSLESLEDLANALEHLETQARDRASWYPGVLGSGIVNGA